jgi:hypothetical protein
MSTFHPGFDENPIDWPRIKRQEVCQHTHMSFMPPNEHGEIWCCVACHKTFTTKAINAYVASLPAA